MPDRPKVAVTTIAGSYPSTAPYHPDEAFPEYRDGPVAMEENAVYRGVRETLRALGYDAQAYGTPSWNPLGALIRPGQRVFIKPNLVTHSARRQHGGAADLFAVITHPSVVRAVADYAALALQGRGELLIGDNSSVDTDFDALLEATRLDALVPLYRAQGLNCRVMDLRPLRTVRLADYGYQSRAVHQVGDPEGERLIDLGEESYFRGISPLLLRGAFNNRLETMSHHHGSTQQYALSSSIFDADVYISVPKLKTHHKVAVTANLKGLVGTVANKNTLPHWRIGFPSLGGDEYPVAHRPLDHALVGVRHLARDLLPEGTHRTLREMLRRLGVLPRLEPKRRDEHERFRGAWQGNDTCWRMVADLYNGFVLGLGKTGERRPRRCFSLVDGVRGGEGDGPFCPEAREARTVLGGEDLLAVDAVAARLMDFDIGAIRYLRALLEQHGLERGDIDVTVDGRAFEDFFAGGMRYLGFKPPTAWRELSLAANAAQPWGGTRPDKPGWRHYS